MSLVIPVARRTARALVRFYLRQKALLWIFFHPRSAARIAAAKAWIFGGAVGRAYSDNSAALHQHVRKTRPDLPIYWVIDRDSADVDTARAVGPILFNDDVRTHVRALLAGVHIISHGIHDVPTCGSRASSRAIKVRLGHGLTALKRTKPRAGHNNESANAVFDLVPVASEFERFHKSEWRIPGERLVVTGLARFDTLAARARNTKPQTRRLIYMPTWRDQKEGDAVASGIAAFLEDPRLARLLETHDAQLDVFLHSNMRAASRSAVDRMEGERIRCIHLSDPQPLFAAAGLLITDYSSVAWDMLYLGRPIIFYQFDRNAFDQDRGSYLPADQLPGPLAVDVVALLGHIETYLDNKIEEDENWCARMRKGREAAFAFLDDGNCERIAREIERLLSALQRR